MSQKIDFLIKIRINFNNFYTDERFSTVVKNQARSHIFQTFQIFENDILFAGKGLARFSSFSKLARLARIQRAARRLFPIRSICQINLASLELREILTLNMTSRKKNASEFIALTRDTPKLEDFNTNWKLVIISIRPSPAFRQRFFI